MINHKLNRREFLKLLSLSTIPYQYNFSKLSMTSKPNIIVMVFDTFSAKNISLYGYPRRTTPNLEKLSQKAIVYHNHYAGGHSTYPGTSTLLTGTHLWTNRGYNPGKRLSSFWGKNNLFSYFKDYNQIAYTHNPLAELVLNEMAVSIGKTVTRQELYLQRNQLLSKLFREDYDQALVSSNRIYNQFDDGYANSLFLSYVSNYLKNKRKTNLIL